MMSAGDYCYTFGISITQLSERTGVHPNVLRSWYKNKPALFDIVLIGATAK